MAIATIDALEGRPTSGASLRAATPGLMGRSAGLIGVGVVAYLVVGLVAGAVVTLFALVLGTMGRNNSDALAAVAVLAGLLLYLGVIVAALVIGVKLIYTLPFLGVEGRGPVAAIKASWSLTTGRFWRTLGYLLVAMLLLYVANVVVSLVSYVVILVTTGVGGLAGRASTDSTAQTLALLAGMVPGLIVTVLLSVRRG